MQATKRTIVRTCYGFGNAFFLVLLVLVALLAEAVNSLLTCTNINNRILITVRQNQAKFDFFVGFPERHQRKRWSKTIFNEEDDINDDDINPPNIDSKSLSKNDYRTIQLDHWENQQRRDFLARLIFIGSIYIPKRASSIVSFDKSLFFRQPIVNNPSDIPSGSSIIDCLFDDLPTRPSNCIRLFLARHGQTENNRLHLVQGARVDTSLNDTGKKQAQRMGQVLKRQLRSSNARFLHSKLKRSKETAAIAALQTVQEEHDVSHDTQQLLKVGENDPVAGASATLVELPSIGEIDFGLQEGMSSASVLSEMYQIYSSWSVGLIDVGPAGGGETGREVLERIGQSFHSIVKLSGGTSQRHDLVAVSHGQFLRMMLAVALDVPVFRVFTTMQQMNGCINVLDISTTENVTITGDQCNLFGGPFLSRLTGEDFNMTLPKINVIRINEIGHLEGLA